MPLLSSDCGDFDFDTTKSTVRNALDPSFLSTHTRNYNYIPPRRPESSVFLLFPSLVQVSALAAPRITPCRTLTHHTHIYIFHTCSEHHSMLFPTRPLRSHAAAPYNVSALNKHDILDLTSDTMGPFTGLRMIVIHDFHGVFQWYALVRRVPPSPTVQSCDTCTPFAGYPSIFWSAQHSMLKDSRDASACPQTTAGALAAGAQRRADDHAGALTRATQRGAFLDPHLRLNAACASALTSSANSFQLSVQSMVCVTYRLTPDLRTANVFFGEFLRAAAARSNS